MQVDLTKKIRTIKGSFFKQKLANDVVSDWDCDLKEVIFGALVATLPNDYKMNVPEKVKVYKLARIVDKAEQTLSLQSEEIVLIKERCAQAYSIEMFGVIDEALEGDA